MSRYTVTAPASIRWNALYLFGGGLVGLALMFAAYQYFLTVTVIVDGARTRVAAGARVADLVSEQIVSGRAGDLVAAKDKRVLVLGGGSPPWVQVNGRRAAADQRLYAADDVRSMDGSNVVEAVALRNEQIPSTTRYRGKGPIERITVRGKPGVLKVTLGSVSGDVVSKRVVRAATDTVIQRERAKRGARIVALTFDDGPWPGSTGSILGILQQNKVKAAFFMIGRQARQSPAIARQVAKAGMLVCSHSETHPDMAKMGYGAVLSEIKKAQTDITAASGQRPRYFRAPGGAISPYMAPILADQKMSLVRWSVDPEDWKRPKAATIVDRVVSQLTPGAVILLHDGGGDRSRTVQALPEVIRRVRAAGYTFVTLDALAESQGKAK